MPSPETLKTFIERVESGDLLWIVLCGATTLALLELLKPLWRNKLIA